MLGEKTRRFPLRGSDLARDASHFPPNKMQLIGERSLAARSAVRVPSLSSPGGEGRSRRLPAAGGPAGGVETIPCPPSGKHFQDAGALSFLPVPSRPPEARAALPLFPRRALPPGAAAPHQQALHVDRGARVADHGLQLPLPALEHPRRRLQRFGRQGSRRHLPRRLLAHPPARLVPGPRRALRGAAGGPSAAASPGRAGAARRERRAAPPVAAARA